MRGASVPGTFPPTLLSLSLPASRRRFPGSSQLRPSVPGRAWGLPTGHSRSTQGVGRRAWYLDLAAALLQLLQLPLHLGHLLLADLQRGSQPGLGAHQGNK